MKTKNVIVSALVAMFVSVSAFANGPVSSKLVIVNQKHGIFKIIYEGAKAGKVSMKISDESGKQLFAETIKSSGFIRPVNFDGMEHGVYSIEITDESGTLVQSVIYGNEKALKRNAYVHKTAEEGKYLLAIANKGVEVINVRIFDGASNLIHDEKVTVNGNYGIVYNLRNIVGVPTFEITDKDGNNVVAE